MLLCTDEETEARCDSVAHPHDWEKVDSGFEPRKFVSRVYSLRKQVQSD